MKMNASVAGIWMSIVMSLQSLGESSLSIKPKGPLFVMEHGKLKLDCTHKGSDGPVKWTKDGRPVAERREFTEHTFRTMDRQIMKVITTLSISKNDLNLGDSGSYKCVLGGQSKQIRVKVLKVQTGSHVITDPGGVIRLQCDPAAHDVDVIWTKNLTLLAHLPDLSRRYALEERNRTLKIHNASLADTGQYECHIKPRVGVMQGNLSAQVVLSGSPYFPDGHNITETIRVSRERLELRCPAQGYPVPEVQWMSGGVRLNSSGGIQLLSYRGVSFAVLIIEDYVPEIGEKFVCEAFNQQGRTSRSFQVVFVNSAQTVYSSSAILLLTFLLTVSLNSKRFRS